MNIEAAERILQISEQLGEEVLTPPQRGTLMTEQSKLWENHFAGEPFENIFEDAWLHRTIARWDRPLVD